MNGLNTIVYTTDFTPCSKQALPYALDLARRHNATLHLLHVYFTLTSGPVHALMTPEGSAGAEGKLEADVFRLHEKSLEGLDTEGIELVPAYLNGPIDTRGILSYARAHKADLMVMGTHGRRGFGHYLLGSVAEEVLRRASCPVFTVRPREDAQVPPAPIRKLLVPTDFSSQTEDVLRLAYALAQSYDAELHLLNVVEPLAYPAPVTGLATFFDVVPDLNTRIKNHMNLLLRRAEPLGMKAKVHVECGPPVSTILEYAEDGQFDLIVMGTHGRTGFSRLLLGSVAERVIRSAPVPVVAVQALSDAFKKAHPSSPSLDSIPAAWATP